MDDEHEEYEERNGGEHVEAVSEEELTSMAVDLLSQLVRNMGFDAQVVAAWHEADDNGERYLLLDIHGHDVSPLIGRRGETLASIQYLVRLMINQRIKRWKNIVVDVEQYKERRVNQLTQLAKRMADQVTQSGRAVSLEPMPANERRIVHLALRDHPSVYTQSSGEGDRRKVHIVSRS
jgi:spoIIIJ-associated protein